MKVSTKLTSIKIIENLYRNFKTDTVNTKMSLQKIVNRSVYLYCNNTNYKTEIDNTNNLLISGSGF